MLARVDQAVVFAMFPEVRSKANVVRYFPLIEQALNRFGILKPELRLAAYATIRAETAGIEPIREGKSRYNTLSIPPELGGGEINLYEGAAGAQPGRKLGNTTPGDGARYMGRGFIQLTGKSNYKTYGDMIGHPDIVDKPELANSPEVAALLLAAFIHGNRHLIETALAQGNFKAAGKAVNGGEHGLDSFRNAYQQGRRMVYRDPPSFRRRGSIA